MIQYTVYKCFYSPHATYLGVVGEPRAEQRLRVVAAPAPALPVIPDIRVIRSSHALLVIAN